MPLVHDNFHGDHNEPLFTWDPKTAHGDTAVVEVDGKFYATNTLDPQLNGKSVLDLLQDWDKTVDLLEQHAASILSGKQSREMLTTGTQLLAPILYPDKMLAVGANYSGHLREMGLEAKKWDSMPFCLRPPKTCLVGPGATVRIPTTTKQFDWECELAVIVAKPLSHASQQEAAAAIAGYAIGFDLSCRDLIQVNNDLKIDLVRGKAQDTMGPCGPTIVPARFITNVDDLRIQLWVNDEKMMDASTSEMLYKVDEQLSVISEYVSLVWCPASFLNN